MPLNSNVCMLIRWGGKLVGQSRKQTQGWNITLVHYSFECVLIKWVTGTGEGWKTSWWSVWRAGLKCDGLTEWDPWLVSHALVSSFVKWGSWLGGTSKGTCRHNVCDSRKPNWDIWFSYSHFFVMATCMLLEYDGHTLELEIQRDYCVVRFQRFVVPFLSEGLVCTWKLQRYTLEQVPTAYGEFHMPCLVGRWNDISAWKTEEVKDKNPLW